MRKIKDESIIKYSKVMKALSENLPADQQIINLRNLYNIPWIDRAHSTITRISN